MPAIKSFHWFLAIFERKNENIQFEFKAEIHVADRL